MLNFGGFLSSNFWSNYRCQSSASIEDLLNSKDCSVDKLLDDDDCLQEFKNYNDKLIKYFEHDKLKTLIDYITVMPTKDDGHNRGHKYPFISGEIFNCEINQILDKFFEAPVKVKEAESEDKTDKSDKDDKDSDAGKSDSDDEKVAEKKKSDDADKEEKKEDAEDGAATNLEEVAEKKEATADEAAEKEKGDENPQAQDEKEEKKDDAEESKAEEKKDEEKKDTDEASEAKEEDKKDEKDDTKEEKKEEAKDEEKNTQEPESEEQENKEAEKKPAEDEKKESEPEEEAPEKKADDSSSTVTTEATNLETQATEGDKKEEEEPENRFVLLDRLFKFIEEGDEDLNPVLSGYFCKLVSLLISRKQKSLVPYIFAPGSTIIEQLLKHVYQKSISEVLNKLLTQLDSDFEPELQEHIQAEQQKAVSTLISSLGPEKTSEHNLNTCTIIQDMFESKEFFNILCRKENLEQIINYGMVSFAEGQKSSKTASLMILNQIITSLIDKQNKKGSKESEKPDRNIDEDDDDMIVQHKSDDEDEDLESNPNSIAAQVNRLVECLKTRIDDIEQVLKPDHDGDKIQGSVCSTEFVPLGQQRLLTVELVHNMIQLKKEVLLKPISTSPLSANIVALVKAYPWNNFLQLKVMSLFTEIIEKSDNENFRKSFMEASGVAKTLIEMGNAATYKMESGRNIRNGYMNLVVQISNQLIKKADSKADAADSEKKEDSVIVNYLESAGDEWKSFVDDELKKSNENNNRTLGGSTTQKDKESDNEDSNYDVQMEKIMARFTNFNQILSQGNTVDDDEEDDDDDENTQDDDKDDKDKKDDKNFDEDDDDGDNNGQNVKKVDPKGPAELVKEFCDLNYWDIGTKACDIDVDALYAELDE